MSRITSAVLVGVAVVTLAACSSTKHTPAVTQPTVSIPASPTSSSASSSSSAPPSSSVAASGLSGTWDGTYSGSFNGTFTLNWTQSGSALTGTIALSTAGTVPITGTVSGSSINFGTVGSTMITYTGSVSSNSMSGNWQISGGAGGSGTWKASKM